VRSARCGADNKCSSSGSITEVCSATAQPFTLPTLLHSLRPGWKCSDSSDGNRLYFVVPSPPSKLALARCGTVVNRGPFPRARCSTITTSGPFPSGGYGHEPRAVSQGTVQHGDEHTSFSQGRVQYGHQPRARRSPVTSPRP